MAGHRRRAASRAVTEPELHLTLPGQPLASLLPATPHRWYVPGIAGTDIAFIPPDSLRISEHGRHLDARRAQAP